MHRLTIPNRTLAALVVIVLASCGEHPAAEGISTAATAAAQVLRDPATGTDCGGLDLHITRDGSELVIHGACREVVIEATRGALNLDRADTIRVQGNRFTVLNADVARVEVAGSGNTLNLTRAGHVRIAGDDNTVLGRALDTVEFSGRGNTVNTSNTPRVEDRGSGNRVI